MKLYIKNMLDNKENLNTKFSGINLGIYQQLNLKNIEVEEMKAIIKTNFNTVFNRINKK